MSTKLYATFLVIPTGTKNSTVSDTGRQCEPAEPGAAWEGQPVDRASAAIRSWAKSLASPCGTRCAFVVETNVHYPTALTCCWMRRAVCTAMQGRGRLKTKVLKWRQWQKLQNTLIDKFNKIRKIRRASRKDIRRIVTAHPLYNLL